ncbi:MAG: carboxypeptidase-like regulatory domain-containing protein [Bacteroidetes bacterium]|nr:MAG: carboxypeptidase-like regulatory domain-containing protein [Bacteroidota bacterium]
MYLMISHKKTLLLVLFISHFCFSQYTIKGRVTDANTNEALPFVIVQFKGTNIGAQTDFDGYYSLKTTFIKDSLRATYVGYKNKSRKVLDQPTQTINFQMSENATELNEVVITPGENPAWEILRRVQANKPKNDKRNLASYEYESYIKSQIDIDNITQKMRKNVVMRKVLAAIDSMKKVTNDEGKPIIPIYINETMSNVYVRNEPVRRKEKVIANKITGVLDESNSQFISQITGSTFTEFNFYENWMRFMGKDFVSPIAESWKGYYDYYLEDTSKVIADEPCYQLVVTPKRAADLAFHGKIWISKKDYALKRCDLQTKKATNINFVDKIKIQQDMMRTSAGPWLTEKLRFLVDMADIGDSTAGMLVKFYVSNKDVKTEEPKPITFFDLAVEVNENAADLGNQNYFETKRHDSLSVADKQVFKMVDTIKNLPIVRTYIEIVDIVVNGHKKVGPIEFGPYLDLFNVNNVEGFRLRLGFRTNMKFNKRLQLKGFLAFGTKDLKLKYGLGAEYWFSKKKWALVGASHTFDIDQVALHNNFRAPGTALFYTLTKWGPVAERSPFYYSTSQVYAQMDIVKGITPKIQFMYEVLNPINNGNPQTNFGYFDQPIPIPEQDRNDIRNYLTNSEIMFELRLAKRETFLFLDHRRISSRVEKFPIITLRYHLGLKGVFGSNFRYDKFSINLYQKVTVGKFGQSIYNITGMYIPQDLPFPLLNVHLGNQSPIYNPVGFSTMKFFEFVSDKSVSLNYQHHFNGFFFNRIPLLRKLKWREVVSFNAIWGTARQSQLDNMLPHFKNADSTKTVDGKANSFEYKQFSILDSSKPYMEVGYGIENIFKIVRVEAYHRLTYAQGLNFWERFTIKIGFQLTL